jgi:hypothetical protein
MTSRIVESTPPEAAWTEQERELLAAERQDHMPAELEARLRNALDLPAVAAIPTQLEAAARTSFSDTASARPLFSSKLPLWGMLSIVALGVVSYYALTRAPSQPRAASFGSERAKATSTLTPPAASPAASATSSLTSPRGNVASAPGAASVDVAHAGVEVAHGDAAESGNRATPDQLRIEAELLEAARKALGESALADARQWLDRYESRFAHRALKPESEVLSIELKVRTGARQAAKTQAANFLTAHPQHPLRDRVRELTTPRPRAR